MSATPMSDRSSYPLHRLAEVLLDLLPLAEDEAGASPARRAIDSSNRSGDRNISEVTIATARTGQPWAGVLYHTTSNENADRIEEVGFHNAPSRSIEVWGPGTYFTHSLAEARLYGEGHRGRRTVATTVALRNPVVGNTFDDIAGQLQPQFSDLYDSGRFESSGEALGAAARARGHDGIVALAPDDDDDGGPQTIVFNPISAARPAAARRR